MKNTEGFDMSRKRKIVAITISVFILATVAYIWGSSMRSKGQSSVQSEGAYSLIKPVLDFMFGKDVVSHGVFRKIAHGLEFLLLGAEINLLLVVVKRYSLKRIYLPLASGLMVAVVDECIQIVSNRGPAVTDVLIDFGGVVVSTFLIALIVCLSWKIKGRKV